ncbi:MAG: ECF-type sigma factor [Xanthomonadales bacterium]|nr:ECF-type sigma factor [Xanthomonadales bacterium]
MEHRDVDITAWLQDLTSGRSEAMEELLPLVYEELRVLARKRLRSERDAHTLSTTGLVNEAYLKFSQQRKFTLESRAEFFGFASECMRRVLVDYARAHRSRKRGSGEQPVPLDQVESLLTDEQAREVTEIDLALDKLNDAFPRGVQVLQHRLFGGLTLEETALALEVSLKTVQRDWTAAIAWLRKEVGVNTFAVE